MDEGSFRGPIHLVGHHVELEPLSVEHAADLARALRDPEVSRLLRNPPGRTPDELAEWIRRLLARQAEGRTVALAIRLRPTGPTVGTTQFQPVDPSSGVVEIGGTFLDSAYWGTPVNPETKRLMLGHAFEVAGAHRVQLQTDLRNVRSQRAIERLGAVREATLREDVLLPDGTYRSSVYYSVLAPEWPGVRHRLDTALQRPRAPRPPVGSTAPPPVVPPVSSPVGAPVSGLPPTSFREAGVLRGRWVELVPLTRDHLSDLVVAGADPAIWEYMRIRHGDTPEGMRRLVDDLLSEQERGGVLPFTVRIGDPPRAVGIIRYLDIRRPDRGVEVGTWLASSVWRTPVNTEAKYLLLRHAFESERVHRVQIKADRRNARSLRAIRRLGAVAEGAMREHYRFEWGGYRTSEYHSLLDFEWPAVRARLEAALARPYDHPVRPPAPGTRDAGG